MLYLVIFIILVRLAYHYDFRRGKRNKNRWYNGILVLFICLSGFRYYVGADTFNYAITYSQYPTLQNLTFGTFLKFRYQPGWILMMSVSQSITESFVLCQLVVAFFLNFSVFKIIKEYCDFPFIAILFYYCAQVFTGMNFEFMREAMAVGVFLLGFKHFVKRAWLKYYVFVFLAFMFHVSAALFILFPLLNIIKLNHKKFTVILAAVFVLIMILGKTVIGELLGLLTFEDSLSATALSYGSRAIDSSKSFMYYIYTFSTYLFFPLILIFYSLSRSKNVIIFPNILLLYFMVSIFSSLSADFIRFNHYLFVFLLINLSNSFYSVFIRFKPKVLFIVLIPLILNFTNFHYLFVVEGAYLSGNKTYNRYYPYVSVFDKEMTDERKVYYRGLQGFKYDFTKY